MPFSFYHINMKNKKFLKWFTLVELIIVITILAILSTIWFVSYNGYLVWVRDTNRISQMATIQDWLEVYRTKNDLPLPESNVEVRANWATIWYQWYMWKNNLETITYSKWWVDPKDWSYFSYYLTSDKKYFQLMWYLEDEANKQVVKWITNQANAATYSTRFPTVAWKKLGILTEATTNMPIQEVSSIKTAWYLDIALTTASYVANYTDKDSVTWSGTTLVKTIYNANCKRIKEIWWNQWNGLYTINPTWASSVQVYCDMSTDWGWWTLIWRSVVWWTWVFWFTSPNWSVSDDTLAYSLWNTDLAYTDILYWTYTTGKDFGTDAFKSVWTLSDTAWVAVTTTKVLWSCTAPFTNLAYAWFRNNTTNFFLSSASTASTTLWLLPGWFTTTSWCTGWNLTWLQWMIFVR